MSGLFSKPKPPPPPPPPPAPPGSPTENPQAKRERREARVEAMRDAQRGGRSSMIVAGREEARTAQRERAAARRSAVADTLGVDG